MPLRGLKLPAFAAAVCMGPGLLLSQPQAARPPAFEVASVRLSIQENNHPQGFRNPSTVIRGISGNRFTEHYITLTELIMQAYQVKDYQVARAPDWGNWFGGIQFDIAAKAEGSGTPPVSQVRLMLQVLLAERFHLKLHRAVKELPVYELGIGKNGAKLKEIGGDATPPVPKGQSPTMRTPMDTLAQMISLRLDRPVIDKTSLAGKTYEFQLDQIALSRCEHQGDETVACVSAEIQKQLGLKLDARKDAVELLLIDHVEKPSEN
jgi:uncharacterized protein (TIGR03435 family)